MSKLSQKLSSRQRAPPSVYPSASWVRAPPHVGKRRVKGGVAAFGRRPWVGDRQGRLQREDRLYCRVDMECRCTRGAVEWVWDADAMLILVEIMGKNRTAIIKRKKEQP